MSALALEELSAIAAIYCGREECEVLEVSETKGISFRIQTSVKGPLGTDILLKLLFHLPLSYPSSLPNISLHSEQLTRTQCLAVRARLLEEAASHLSQPMVHELILWIKQNFQSVVEEAEIPACSGQSTPSVKTAEDDVWTALLHLDHMRAKGKYIKTVEKWCRDLDLAGRLMFMGKMILILLQGDKRDIKEYLMLQKTSKVDVDSSGKKCKEKMMCVLFETKVQAEHRRKNMLEEKYKALTFPFYRSLLRNNYY
ncbi:RWD domain-containing protein 3 isoform X2 [Crotalus tigris]|uniref:RWD domain-containing protein 3 isoform X2 n=1 Tax=Crotalus tigris TaxID=88082 RepID=UPI00192F6F19|nr:RWD domain-containing protein 3 isoform X2 [Crotalus tigris]XP_039195721.1 RWD domain-containing protein 3 isoform X2 [Crotalus tigris]XP_039195722.1 RWD domain-containing protein 3 isoform X2 [Crotalus tigris]XP_039195724.1 RWD domain-containing protein 3 isoform X2 [Crotalus tigris]XP_039195725.1 RWD domain-containing protein 3 isoform X2 [Crotalus tigris]XP_039195726.1 RWD domain-containing protein 3 isoform X2 [Crotalus tigris]